MKDYNEGRSNDPLRGEFTVWLQKLVLHAKLNYIRNHPVYLRFISIDDLSEEATAVCDDPVQLHPHEFDFEDARLAEEFRKLTKVRRTVLTMLFVEMMSPEEIAAELGCSIEAVYNNRSRALKQLRRALHEEDETK